MPNDRAFSTEEIAGILGIDKTTAYGLVRACMELEACRQVGTRRAPSGKGKGTNLYAFNPDAGITLAAAIDKILKIS